jgi:mRNA interferase RelE/StbE
MDLYRLIFKPGFHKSVKRIPEKDRTKIIQCIDDLAFKPRPRGCEQLSGQTKYRMRQGDYRILYIIDDTEHTVRIIKVGHRRDVYLARESKAEYNAMEKQSTKTIRSKT